MHHNDATPTSQKKRQVQPIDVPPYDDLNFDTNCVEILPCAFLPTMVGKLSEHRFYAA